VTGQAETPTLYEWAGGQPAIAAMIGAFYDRVEHDELISPLLPGGVSREHRDHVIAWWCEVFGGPADYTGTLGGYHTMVEHHRNLEITPEQRFRFASLMSLAADDADLPSDAEFRAALVGYLEWGTRLAMHNSQPGAVVIEQAPVPRWGWGVAPPDPASTTATRLATPTTRISQLAATTRWATAASPAIARGLYPGAPRPTHA
jgi:hemoglobin